MARYPDNAPILHGARFELEVARDPDEVFAYLVVEGPARSRNAYDVEETPDGARVVMQGSVPLDSWYLRLVGPLLKLSEDWITRGEMKRLSSILSGPVRGRRRR